MSGTHLYLATTGEVVVGSFIVIHSRKKFRSQTSDNMDRWKGRGGKSQRGEEPKREEQRRERVRRKKMQVREKAGSCETVRFSNDLWLRGVEK